MSQRTEAERRQQSQLQYDTELLEQRHLKQPTAALQHGGRIYKVNRMEDYDVTHLTLTKPVLYLVATTTGECLHTGF